MSRHFLQLQYMAACLALAALLTGGCAPGNKNQVVVYTSQDQVFAEPILNQFAKETGIQVRTVYDSEAVKTVGLVNRLFAEKSHPQCDLFWNNEELRTRQLAAQGVVQGPPGLVTLGYRSRRLVVPQRWTAPQPPPRTFQELTNTLWRGKIALAYPLFGTTATHFLALRQQWGEAGWRQWCRALQANQPLLVDGNSVVVKLVAGGEALVGMTDSDDIAAAVREGLHVREQPLAPDALLIPNTVALVSGAPHPEAARALMQFLQGREVARQLTGNHAWEGVSASATPGPTLPVEMTRLLRELEPATADLKTIFLR